MKDYSGSQTASNAGLKKKQTLSRGHTSGAKSRNEESAPHLTMNVENNNQQTILMQQINTMQSRPMSGQLMKETPILPNQQDENQSPRMDAELIAQAVEQHVRFGGGNASDSEPSSSFVTDDVSSDTHNFSSAEEDNDMISSDSDPEPDLEQTIRVYDARFKIPAQSNIGQLMAAKNSSELTKGQSSKQYRNMVKRLERYKKFVSTTAICFMFLAMVYNIAVYGLLVRDLQQGKYYLARTRYDVVKQIDFEDIQTNEIKYFLYRNETEGAMDAGDDLNTFIAQDIEVLCENDGVFLDSDYVKLLSVRDNLSSAFMLTSEAYILLLMFICMVFATIIIP